MRLGMITWIYEEDFKKAKERGLDFVELDVNSRDEEFLGQLENIKRLSKAYQMPIGAVGRWGTDRINAQGVIDAEVEIQYRLIDATAALGCDIYITGCNYVEELSYFDNCRLAIEYLQKLLDYGKKKGVRIATNNCRWNNFVCTPTAFQMIHGHLKDLYIKYDPSHCIEAGGDYLQEAKDWGDRFLHVHLKGTVRIGGECVDFPPAGLDQTDWPTFLAILYAKGYNGNLSIEPESSVWQGEMAQKGIDYSIRYFRNLII